MKAKPNPLSLVTSTLSGPSGLPDSVMSAPISVEIPAAGRASPIELPGSAGAADIPGFIVKHVAGSEIHGEGETASYAYRVVSGVVRTCQVLADGRRQVEGFHFPGDVFSMTPSDHYEESAEAITDVQVFVMRRSLLAILVENDPAVSRELLKWTSQSLIRARRQILLLGRKTALEKVASFLLQLEASGKHPDGVVLSMPRSDIADYLGLTVETVSRVLTRLERDRAIALTRCRHVRVTCRSRLIFLSGPV